MFGGPLDRILPEEVLRESLITQPNYPTRHSEGHLSDTFWMMEAFRESLLGIGISNPNPSVGCVIVDSEGKELARGNTQAYTQGHAERVALDRVQNPEKLKGATAYITLEPCSHRGHQPPCVDALLATPIQRVVISRTDPNPLVGGQGIQKLKEAGKIVELGLLADEGSAWNFPFLAQQILKRPMVALKWAQTLDGQLADDSDTSQWITGAAARAYTHWLRQRYDIILVGGRTAVRDLPSLNVRDCAEPHQANPLPVIFDPQGLCLNAKKEIQENLLKKTFQEKRKVVLVTSEKTLKDSKSSSKIAASAANSTSNITILAIPGTNPIQELLTVLDGPEVKKILNRPLQSIFVEGGPRTLSSFIQADRADVIHTMTAPLITGGLKNRIHVGRLLKNAKRWQLVATARLGNDIVTEMVPEELYKKVFQTG